MAIAWFRSKHFMSSGAKIGDILIHEGSYRFSRFMSSMGMLSVQRMAELGLTGFYLYNMKRIAIYRYNINLYIWYSYVVRDDAMTFRAKKAAGPPLPHVAHSTAGGHVVHLLPGVAEFRKAVMVKAMGGRPTKNHT